MNELVPGEPRLCWFYDGNPDTEHRAVMLRDTGTAVELTVPLRDLYSDDDPYGRWWASSAHFGDDPDRTKYSYGPPRVLLVEDQGGTVVLVGCRTSQSSTNFRIGHGRIIANYAVLGGTHDNYESVNGLRTEIPALLVWTQLSSLEMKPETDGGNRWKSMELKLSGAKPVSLSPHMGLEIQPLWRTDPYSLGKVAAYETVELQTRDSLEQSWDAHLGVHRAVVDLVSIAGWQPFGVAATKVQRDDDPEMNAVGHDRGERWSPVVTHMFPEHQPWERDPHFLFWFNDVGPSGVERWLDLRKAYARVIDPMMTILYSERPWSQSSMVQSGIALEALAYLIDINKNGKKNLNSKGQMSFRRGLEVVLDELKVVPLVDSEEWKKRTRDVYTALKHPDKAEPDTIDMLNAFRENLLVLRCWIALELGVTSTSLMDALRTDPLHVEFGAAN